MGKGGIHLGDACTSARLQRRSVRAAQRDTSSASSGSKAQTSRNTMSASEELFFAEVHLHGGPAPVRRFLPTLIDLIWNRKINPGKVFDLTLPLESAHKVVI
jgi:threonine dehydrogenase-like Zn-dependent dehydrogenase